MLMIGLTGGIGSGKSAVAGRLAERGATVIDSDRLARKVVAAGSAGLAEVVEAFGPDVLTADGDLDRAVVARLVFADPDQRRVLESIIHPRVRRQVAELVAAAPPDAIVVNDVPLLVEAGLAATYDLVMVVLATEETRMARLVRDRGMPEAEVRGRIAAQATDAQRREVADIVIDNNAGLAELFDTVDAVWRDQVLPAADASGPPAASR